MKYPLITGHGNYGDLDGSPAAAYRYTEAKLSSFGELMMDGIDKDAVEMVPNFDDSTTEMSVLPGPLPLILLNGSSGIAVAVTASFAPHCAKDIFKAIDKILADALNNIDTTEDEIIDIIQAPDFPTGGTIVNPSEVRKAYKEGYGKVVIRSKYHFEKYGKQGRDAIVVDEIPYKVNKSNMVAQISKLAFESDDEDFKGKFKSVRDESGKEGVRIVMELAKDVPAERMVKLLLARTDMQTTFSLKHTAIIDGHPKENIPLSELLSNWIYHYADVTRREISYEKERANERHHLLEAIITVISNLDECINLIRSSKTRAAAISSLKNEYGFDDKQAEAVARINLVSLNEEDYEKYRDEQNELANKINEYENILSDDIQLFSFVKAKLKDVSKQFKNEERKTNISEVADERDIIPETDIVVAYTHSGYIKAVKLEEYNAQGRNGKGVSFKTKDNDFVESVVNLSTLDNLVLISDKGKAYTLPAYKVQISPRTSLGKLITNYIELESNEHIIKFLPVKKDDLNSSKESIFFVTAKGIGKRLFFSELPQTKKGARIISMKDGEDTLTSVSIVKEDEEIAIVTANGQITRFPVKKIRPMGRSASGVMVMKLKEENDKIVTAFSINDSMTYLQVTANGFAKRVKCSEIPVKLNRGGGGVKIISSIEKSGHIVAAMSIEKDADCFVITKNGMSIRVPVNSISSMGRTSVGVKLIKLDENDRVSSVTVVSKDDNQQEERK